MLSSGIFEIDSDHPVTLFIVDPQIDFHFGSLAIQNASGDAARIAGMIRANSEKIDHIIITMDSRHRNHISHAVFWKSGEGFIHDSHAQYAVKKKSDPTVHEPKPFIDISTADIKEKIWVPVDQSLLNHCMNYTSKLASIKRDSKYYFGLKIWPEHCLIGTKGHSVEPSIHDAVQQWSRKRQSIVHYVFKGTNCLTEMYSAIQAEVQVSTDPQTQPNEDLLEELRKSARAGGKLILCGQALSHCVNYTLRDIVADWELHSLDLGNLCLLVDGSSPADDSEECSLQVQELLADMTAKGIQLTTCGEVFEVTNVVPQLSVLAGDEAVSQRSPVHPELSPVREGVDDGRSESEELLSGRTTSALAGFNIDIHPLADGDL